MNKQKIAIKKLAALVIESQEIKQTNNNDAIALSVNAEAMNLGFILSEELLKAMSMQSVSHITELSENLIEELRVLKGDHVVHRPMYPNFPEQVIEAEDVELFVNALNHYWSNGQWQPHYFKVAKPYAFESTKFKELSIADEEAFKNIFTQLLMANDSLSKEDTAIVEWFLLNYAESDLAFPEEIPFQENKSAVAAILLAQQKDITMLINTTTDVLRVATYLSDGDVSLASNTKFVSLPRSLRKELVKQLERVISEEDIGRHKNKWKALLHNLHVGDYSKKVYQVAKKLRSNQPLESFYGRLEYFLNIQDIESAIKLLKTRPSEFARKLDHLLRLSNDNSNKRLTRLLVKKAPNHQQLQVVQEFLSISAEVSSRTLVQLLGHMNRRHSDADKRVVFPKGNTQKAVVLRDTIAALDTRLVSDLTHGIKQTLIQRFATLEPLGKVWLDPSLMDCPLPSQQRSASEGLVNVARGTRLSINDAEEKNTLRFFIYWVGKDIDLSATFHYEDFSVMEQLSYTRLRLKSFKAFHSGDITSAPNGASEFIDITIDGALKKGARYLTMNVLVYNGPTFDQHEECFAGWMMRSEPKSNEVFDAKTVEVSGN